MLADRHCERSAAIQRPSYPQGDATGLPRYARNDAPSRMLLKTAESSVKNKLFSRDFFLLL
jgi:hypothetical protein